MAEHLNMNQAASGREEIVLSLLVAYRDRPLHLKCMLEWFGKTVVINPAIELIIIEYSLQPSIVTDPGPRVKHIHVKGDGNFNKARLLNIGLQNSRGKLVSSYDVDLVPVDLSFRRHLALAEAAEIMLVAGHRLNCSKEYIDPEEIENERRTASIYIRDECSEAFWRDQLLDGHRFGVIPLFNRERMIEAGAWDERFEGWGAEDKDAIERYLGDAISLVRCPDLLYLHLNHGKAAGWNDMDLIMKNHSLYDEKKEIRKTMSQSNNTEI